MNHLQERVNVFTNNHPFVGPVFWIASIQYFIVQLIVIAAWTVPHSWKNNYISDLGNTMCGTYNGIAVCSPLHPLMNVSFVVFGATILLGSILIYTEFKRTRLSAFSFFLMGMSGLGTILVGLFPENTIGLLHIIGAFLGLVVGNVAIVMLGFALTQVRTVFRYYTVISGTVSLVAFVLFYTENYLGLGVGGMERLVSYPFALWMMLFGIYMTTTRARATMNMKRHK